MNKLKVLLLLISLVTNLISNEISFKELTKLASQDLGTNIYLDKDVEDYKVYFNIVEHQSRGEIYEFYKIVLFDNNLFLQYNKKGKFYFIKKKNTIIEPIILDELPLPAQIDRKHYYSYTIKYITNEDVVKVMDIFTDVNGQAIKYTYLPQSDMIAYACTSRIHGDIKRMLSKSDNSVLSKTIKITLFTTNKTKILNFGSNITAFNYSFSSTMDGVLSSLKSGNSQRFNIKDSASLGFTLFALQGHGLADIKQEPIMYLTNGKKSQVDYVKNISYKVSSITRKDNTETTTDQLQYRDIGFKLSVLPKIKANWVYLDLDLVSEELLTADDNQLPVTQKISYKNSVKVYKGKPILLTGLKKTSKKIERGGVPVLKDLPIIGQLFKSKKEQSDIQNINLLIEVL